MQAGPKRRRALLFLGAPIVLGGLALLDAASIALTEGEASPYGFLLGLVVAGAMFSSLYALKNSHEGVRSVAAAALLSLVELAIAVLLAITIALAVTTVLPDSLFGRVVASDKVTDLIVMVVLLLSGMITLRSWYRHAQQRRNAQRASIMAAESRALVAERDRALAQSELALMRAQIEPHFLWNTLSHVQYLAKKHPEGAVILTGHLIRYLRGAVPRMRSELSTVAAEIESSYAYLELMKIRMGGRLQTSVTISDDVGDRPLPPLLIQTLVENAIKHGVEPKVGPVSVHISAGLDQLDRDQMFIEVGDDGVGLQSGLSTSGTGMGLHSVRERLRMLYGEAGRLVISGPEEGGAIFRIVVPMRRPGSHG